MLRLYFKTQPETLTDEAWAKQWNDLKWLISKGHPKVFIENV